MAAIDKTYVNKKQLIEAIDWAKEVGDIILKDGHKFNLLDYIRSYNDIDDPEFLKTDKNSFVLWNTPTWLDEWLWKNCPLLFVREYFKDVYDREIIEKWTS